MYIHTQHKYALIGPIYFLKMMTSSGEVIPIRHLRRKTSVFLGSKTLGSIYLELVLK